MSLPLYEGVDWNRHGKGTFTATASLPLYEGVDWNFLPSVGRLFFVVSLFTREWIEMFRSLMPKKKGKVSLFTREWIEIPHSCDGVLKTSSLPLYEGVDWNLVVKALSDFCLRLPLYEGVDWNVCWVHTGGRWSLSPSLRGSGLKLFRRKCMQLLHLVSLFTREWIEMSDKRAIWSDNLVSLFTREWIESLCS